MAQHNKQPIKINNSELKSDRVQALLEKSNDLQGKNIPYKSTGLFSVAAHYSDKGLILDPNSSEALCILRTGLLLGEHMQKRYADESGLEMDKSKTHHSDEMKLQVAQKRSTSTLVGLFATAYYCKFHFSDLDADLTDIKINLPEGLLNQDYITHTTSVKTMLLNLEYSLVKQLDISKDINSFVKVFVTYFDALLEELIQKHESFKYTEFYTKNSYILEDTQFTLQGFEVFVLNNVESINFNKVSWGEIVGNQESKSASRRLLLSALCYNTVLERNVMQELGAYSKVNLAYGPPGTGKSLEIAAIATELSERCADIGRPFMFAPFPDNIVSTYQGGSAERAQQYMQMINDPKKIIFAPIDDAENNLQSRDDESASAGVREVVGVFLRYTEGAYASNYGNLLINMYTNLPEIIDSAVLSRVQKRYYMGGAESINDMMDQNHLGLVDKYDKLIPGFIDLSDPTDYIYMSDQKNVDMQARYQERSSTDVVKIQNIFNKLQNKFKLNSPEFFGNLFKEVQQIFPNFTSREVRNIHSAVNTRLFDFDFPSEWLDDPTIFLLKDDLEQQKGMVTELVRENAKGKSFADIFLQESMHHISNLAVISDVNFEKAVSKQIELREIHKEADARLMNKHK